MYVYTIYYEYLKTTLAAYVQRTPHFDYLTSIVTVASLNVFCCT